MSSLVRAHIGSCDERAVSDSTAAVRIRQQHTSRTWYLVGLFSHIVEHKKYTLKRAVQRMLHATLKCAVRFTLLKLVALPWSVKESFAMLSTPSSRLDAYLMKRLIPYTLPAAQQ